MRDQHLETLKQAIIREIGYMPFRAAYKDPNQELVDITREHRQWREIVSDALAKYDIIPTAADIDHLVDRYGTVHDLVDYIQHKLDEKEQPA